MRKFWAIGLLLLVTAISVHAQEVDRRLRLGVAVGGEATTFINNPFNVLVSEIAIPGANVDLNLRLRIGRHWSLQLTPGYTIMPYRSDRNFIGDGVDEQGNPDPFNGRRIHRTIHCDLHEGRLLLQGKFHFKDTRQGWYVGGGLEVQRIRLSDFDMTMKEDSVTLFHVGAESYDLPTLVAGTVCGGYSHPLYNNYLLTVEPFVKYSPLFTKDAKILSWGTAGMRVGFWL